MGEEGFEPPTPWFVATCSNPLSYRPHPVSTRPVPRSTLQETFLLPSYFCLRRCESAPSLYKKKNCAFRGVKWERFDLIIGVLNKTTFSLLLPYSLLLLKKGITMKGLSFLSSWRRAIFPQDLPYSIVTAVEFNHQVRDGLVWFLYA